ncbi:Uncharacterised protein [uncultured Ruminococcus sp.]|nr:Uncharacterised protein [uncultured Ruminococcus sp.]
MKKKTIEKIPYLKLPENVKKGAKYVGTTAVKVVGHEKHLFLEVYRNKKASREIPLVRIVLTKKDFGSYFPEQEEWNRKKIKINGKLLWNGEEDCRDGWQQLEKKNILRTEEDLERIKSFCKTTIWKEERWWGYIEHHQNCITRTERSRIEVRKYERRQTALEERSRNTKILPEAKILKIADERWFHQEHHLYYKKYGNWVQIACSKCGGVTDARWKAGDSYESQFQQIVQEPRENKTGKCPMCGAYGTYKCQGKAKHDYSKRMHLFLGQKYKTTGMVMRYVEVTKEWKLELIAGENGTEMHGAYEELSGVEIARAYFEPGKDVQIDYHKHNPYSGKDFWDDCNLSGNYHIRIEEAPILADTYKEMKDTMFQYSALKEYASEIRNVNIVRYLEQYQQTPQIEVLVKMGLFGIAKEIVDNCQDIVSDASAKRPDTFLGIRKERVHQLIVSRGDIKLLGAMKTEKRLQQAWTEKQIEHLAETGLRTEQVETAIKYMGIQKILNRIEKYAGCAYGTKCAEAENRIRATANTYMDYINMRLALGYDMNNTVYQQPRNLVEAHNQIVLESNKEEMDIRIREVEQKYPSIRAIYRELRKIYFYEDDTYLIRPARSAGEIVREGRLLHHCVGGDNYLGKHNRRESYILMLRFKDKAEEPYITVEISSNNPKIRQWYGTNDRKPDAKNMQKWLNDYLKQLKEKREMLAKTA